MGSPAPTPAPHTPVMYLLAGGMANFSAACAKLLMKAGYDPASFGSHSYVQALTERAKQRVAYYKKLKSEGNPHADEFRPPDADFELAECEAVPLATDPNRPLAQMPARAAKGPSTVPGTEASNAQRSAANGGDAGQSAQDAVAARSGEKPQLARNGEVPPRSKAELAKEDAQRAKIDEAIGGQARAGGNQGAAPTRSKGKSSKKIQGKSAGECVDNFVKQSLADLASEKSNSAKANEGAAAGGEGGGGADADSDGKKHDKPLHERIGWVDEYGEQKKVTGDGTADRDHQPSKAAIKKAVKDDIDRRVAAGEMDQPNRAQLDEINKRIDDQALSVVVTHDVHKEGPTHGNKNKTQSEIDKRDLGAAAARDADAMVANTRVHDPDNVAASQAAADKIKQQTHDSIMEKNRAIVDDVMGSDE